MAELNSLRDALVDEVKDLFHAEKQLTKALPKLAKNATNTGLREALQSHLLETEEQIARLEQVFELLDEPARGKHCAGMAGIIEEGNSMLEEDAEDAVKDACIIAAGQRAEHYEMAAYGTCVAWATALGLDEVAQLLQATLDEEKAADEKLSSLADGGINQEASADERENDTEDEAESGRESAVGAEKGRGPRISGRGGERTLSKVAKSGSKRNGR